jgi:hypothetical protein
MRDAVNFGLKSALVEKMEERKSEQGRKRRTMKRGKPVKSIDSGNISSVLINFIQYTVYML